jgi:hypothetical protein
MVIFFEGGVLRPSSTPFGHMSVCLNYAQTLSAFLSTIASSELLNDTCQPHRVNGYHLFVIPLILVIYAFPLFLIPTIAAVSLLTKL